VSGSFFVAKAQQAISCLHEISFAGRKNIETLCFEMSASYNRVGDSLLGCNKKFLRNFLLHKKRSAKKRYSLLWILVYCCGIIEVVG